MLTKFIEGLGSKLGEQWNASLLIPPFMFWTGGLGVWVYRYGWNGFLKRYTTLSPAEKIIWPVVIYILIALSASVAQRLEIPVLRLLEGYWPQLRPVRWLWVKLVARKKNQIQSMMLRWQALKVKEEKRMLAPEEIDDLRALEWKLHHVPPVSEQYMPTRLSRPKIELLLRYNRADAGAVNSLTVPYMRSKAWIKKWINRTWRNKSASKVRRPRRATCV